MRASETVSVLARRWYVLLIGALIGLLVGGALVMSPPETVDTDTKIRVVGRSLPQLKIPADSSWGTSDTQNVITSVVAFGLGRDDVEQVIRTLGYEDDAGFITVNISQANGFMQAQTVLNLTRYEASAGDAKNAAADLKAMGRAITAAILDELEARTSARIPAYAAPTYLRRAAVDTIVAPPAGVSTTTKALHVAAGLAGGLLLASLIGLALYLRRPTIVGRGGIEDLTDLPITVVTKTPNALGISLALLEAQVLDTEGTQEWVALATSSTKDYGLLSHAEVLQGSDNIVLLDASDPAGLRQAKAAKQLAVVALAHRTSVVDLRTLLQSLAVARIAPTEVLLVPGEALGLNK